MRRRGLAIGMAAAGSSSVRLDGYAFCDVEKIDDCNRRRHLPDLPEQSPGRGGICRHGSILCSICRNPPGSVVFAHHCSPSKEEVEPKVELN